jgi:hypothetical protein
MNKHIVKHIMVSAAFLLLALLALSPSAGVFGFGGVGASGVGGGGGDGRGGSAWGVEDAARGDEDGTPSSPPTRVGVVVDVVWEQVSELAGALDLLEDDEGDGTLGWGEGIEVHRYSLAERGDLSRLLGSLRACRLDILLFKGCWSGKGAAMMGLIGEIRKLFGGGISVGFMAACTGRPPDWQLETIDHLIVETPFALDELRMPGLPASVAFGINTTAFSPLPEVERTWDIVSAGELGPWKRFDRLATRMPGGKKAVMAKRAGHKGEDGLSDVLRAAGVVIFENLTKLEMAAVYRSAKLVYMPAVLRGGGERVVLEAMACGASVEVIPGPRTS